MNSSTGSYTNSLIGKSSSNGSSTAAGSDVRELNRRCEMLMGVVASLLMVKNWSTNVLLVSTSGDLTACFLGVRTGVLGVVMMCFIDTDDRDRPSSGGRLSVSAADKFVNEYDLLISAFTTEPAACSSLSCPSSLSGSVTV